MWYVWKVPHGYGCSRSAYHQAAGQIGHALLEFLDRLVEVLVGGLGVGKERIEQVAKLLGLAQIRDRVQLAVLI